MNSLAQPRPPVLAGIAAGLWAAAIALAVLVANASAVPAVDTGISDPVHAWALDNEWSVNPARLFALMGSGKILFPITVLVVVGLVLRKHRWWASWVALACLGGLLISETVKNLVDRQRPDWPGPFETLTSPSFASGHAMAGIYGWVVFGVVALSLLREPWNRIAAGALMTFGVLTGPSRVVLGVHWPTDVLEGWLLAAAWVLTISAALLWWPQRIAPGA